MGVGERIATERKIAGLTQRQLVARMHYSLAMLKAVEQGREPASAGFIAATAKALRLSPDALTGTPYDDGKPLSEAINGMSILLAEGRYARAIEPRTATLGSDLAAAQQLFRDDNTRQAIEVLPDIIRRFHGLVHETAGQAQAKAYSQLAQSYRVAASSLRRTGWYSVMPQALDLADTYSMLGDDPYHGPFTAISRARLLTGYGESEVAASLVESSLSHADDTYAGFVLAGQSHLAAAINEARRLDYPTAMDHIAAARECANRTGETDLYMSAFGPSNVEIHAHAVELEAGDPNKAAREGQNLQVSADVQSPTRIGHHYMDNARAWVMIKNGDKALAALNKARRYAPQQTRLHPGVRETMHAIAQLERRKTDTLVGFASWLGTSV